MSLYILATPIGHPKDITIRGVEYLESAQVIIGEERRETEKLLKKLKIQNQAPIESLNEHSTAKDLEALSLICVDKKVVLVSDCGTPGFQDPGAELIQLCRKKNISVSPLPGPSSLMTMLSMLGHRMQQFFFAGFLPVESQARLESIKSLQQVSLGIILMDTPYRLKKLLAEIHEHFPGRQCVLGINMTQIDEAFLEGKAFEILEKLPVEKAEFMLVLLPVSGSTQLQSIKAHDTHKKNIR